MVNRSRGSGSVTPVRVAAALLALYLGLLSVPLRVESLGPAVMAGMVGVYALDPGVYRFLGGDFDPEEPTHGVALLGVLLAMWLVVVQPLVVLVRIFVLGEQPSFNLSGDGLYVSLVANTLILVAVPLAWAHLVNSERSMSRSLGLNLRSPAVDTVIGVAAAFGTLLVVGGVNYLLVTYAGIEPSNPLAERIVELIDIRTAFVISVAAAVGEELFFRGFLQTRIGLVPAAVLFSIGHSSYGVLTQIIGPLLFGLVLGYVFQRRRSLVPTVVSHFTFNFVVFYVAIRFGMGM